MGAGMESNPEADVGLTEPIRHADPGIDLSVIVPVTERHDDLVELYQAFASELNRLGRRFEFIFVIDGSFPSATDSVRRLMVENPGVRLVTFERRFGESATLSVGFQKARGLKIMTLSAYFQVQPAGIREILDAANQNDLVITRRHPRSDHWINRLQAWGFHWMTSKLVGSAFSDLGCGLRVLSRDLVDNLALYGDLHRFIPVMAQKQGYKIAEVAVPQHAADRGLRLRQPGIYLRRMLDILIVFFLSKFTRKPLRFFGLIGSFLFMGGSVITVYLGLYRILGFGGIADRPLLLLGVLLMVLGVQLLSIGLIGEIVIFTHGRQLKDYRVEEVIEK